MAASIADFLEKLTGISAEEREILTDECRANRLVEVIDFGMLDDDDLKVFSVPYNVALLARDSARPFNNAWAKGRVRAMSQATGGPLPLASVPSSAPRPFMVGASARKMLVAVTRSKLQVRQNAQSAPHPQTMKCLEEIERERMAKALRKIHDVFVRNAGESPRMMLIANASHAEADLQRDVYRRGSRSHVAVARRGAQIEAFFLDMKVFGWDPSRLTVFQVATWIRSRLNGGTKTAGRIAKQTLQLVAEATEYALHCKDPLVLSQVTAVHSNCSAHDPPKVAKTPTIEMLSRFEELVFVAETVQQRCFAGFFVLLGSVSARASDAQRTRSLTLEREAITGVSRMKSKRVWTRWYCDRCGILKPSWAQEWFSCLTDVGLPGADFILNAANVHMNQWLDRPAEYADIRRALHLLLMLYFNMSPEQAAEYNPHGFRHIMVGAGQQLRAIGEYRAEDVERLGHWAKGSAMPERYDNEAGVSELSARVKIMDALRCGWRPVRNGEKPMQLPKKNLQLDDTCKTSLASPGSVGHVGHRRQKRTHRIIADADTTACKRWKCGTPTVPGVNAVFENIPCDWQYCSVCWGNVGITQSCNGSA